MHAWGMGLMGVLTTLLAYDKALVNAGLRYSIASESYNSRNM